MESIKIIPVYAKDLTPEIIKPLGFLMRKMDQNLNNVLMSGYALNFKINEQEWFNDYLKSLTLDKEDYTRGYILAYLGEVMVGYIHWELSSEFSNGISINEIFVEASHRRQGIASSMLEWAFNYFKIRMRVFKYHLEVIDTNVPAKKLYAKFGFNKVLKVNLLKTN